MGSGDASEVEHAGGPRDPDTAIEGLANRRDQALGASGGACSSTGTGTARERGGSKGTGRQNDRHELRADRIRDRSLRAKPSATPAPKSGRGPGVCLTTNSILPTPKGVGSP